MLLGLGVGPVGSAGFRWVGFCSGLLGGCLFSAAMDGDLCYFLVFAVKCCCALSGGFLGFGVFWFSWGLSGCLDLVWVWYNILFVQCFRVLICGVVCLRCWMRVWVCC